MIDVLFPAMEPRPIVRPIDTATELLDYLGANREATGVTVNAVRETQTEYWMPYFRQIVKEQIQQEHQARLN
jgi:hypothetical protein